MVYVGAAETSEYDQVLDSILVGPIPTGINKFVFAVNTDALTTKYLNIDWSFC